MRVSFWISTAALLLAGCGSGEDFTVKIDRPAASARAPFATIDLSQARSIFPGIAVKRSRPSDDELLYTIPADDGGSSTVLFRFEPSDDGRTTTIHTTVDTAPVRATLQGKPMVLSEKLVEVALRKLMQEGAKSLESGREADESEMGLSMFMMGLAVASNKAYLARAIEIKDNDAALGEALAAFAPDADEQPSRETSEGPMDDPDEAQFRDASARDAADRADAQALDEAAAAQDDASPQDEETPEE